MKRASKFFSDLSGFWRQYKRNRFAVLCLAFVILLASIALLAPWVAPYPPMRIGVAEVFAPPTAQHLMGSDNLGRDVFSMVVFGARTSLFVGFLAATTSVLIGLFVGSISGYLGGWVDDLLMRISEIVLIIPRFVLALVLAAIFGSTALNVIVVIGLLSWPVIARVCRAEFLSLKEREYVLASRSLGESTWSIIFSEILPNAMPPLVTAGTLQVGAAILMESSLSFLGLGDPNVPSWGYIASSARIYIFQAWWIIAFPGILIFLTVLSVNFIGDWLNFSLNPKTRERGYGFKI